MVIILNNIVPVSNSSISLLVGVFLFVFFLFVLFCFVLFLSPLHVQEQEPKVLDDDNPKIKDALTVPYIVQTDSIPLTLDLLVPVVIFCNFLLENVNAQSSFL